MKKFISLLVAVVLLTFPLFLFSADELVFSVLITRHGDRVPFAKTKNLDYNWGSFVSELTPIGMNQEYNLGSVLRQKYVEKDKLLKPNYEANSILTYSSNTNRTIMSAQCILLGLYPPGTGPTVGDSDSAALPDRIQVIPVRTLPDSSTMILMPYPEYLKLLEKYVYSTQKWKDAEKETQPKMKKWSAAVDYNIKSLGDVLTVGDILICAKSHNLPYPAGLSDKDAQEIIELTNYKLAHQFHIPELSYLMGGQLLNTIEANIDDFINARQPYKIVYYSGHDITILPIMTLLGSPLNTAPGYASHISIELWKDDSSKHYIKVDYNNKYVKLPVMNSSDTCSYEDFKKLVDSVNEKYKNLKLPAN
ncbi:MAG TPA: acid phosphatase [Lentisphaeria bacterium]|nr:MAG: hypothetical protein A2X47_05465 [Lentisphaerae bacterium GWF2_38_69]HBM17585.1 acid phosphatase [Lentisphaeria bacterium]